MLKRRFNPPSIIEHQALGWLIIAMLPAALLHWEIVPWWLTGFALVVIVYRVAVYKTWIPGVSKWLKVLIMFMMAGIFAISSHGQFTVENSVGFFLLAYSLKMIELNARRDAYIFSFMTLFLLTLGLLFGQSLFRTIYVFVFLGIGLVALSAISSPLRFRSMLWSVGRIYGLMALAVPLLIVLYLVFPRIGPLWTMPLKSTSAFTGLDDSVSPGDVANLAQSGERAFRVAFNDELPSREKLYWRGLILDNYERGRWSRTFFQRNQDQQILRRGQQSPEADYDYEVLLDPHNREWGFALQDTQIVSGEAYSTPDRLVHFPKDVKSATWYRMAGRPPEIKELSRTELYRYTSLSPEENQQTRQWAEEIVEHYPDTNDQIQHVLNYLNDNEYFYSLNPPLLPAVNRADAFLFGSRKGFCEHYASSIGIAFRAMGIPTRMLVGYQGGEWNKQGEFLVIHQYDAHAWLEVWLPEQGWIKVDPTAAVAPNRVLSGIREAVADEGSFLQNSPLSLARFEHINLIFWLREQAEYINYQWISTVVNYNQETQRSLLGRLFGKADIQNLAIVLALFTVLLFAALTLYGVWPEWQRKRKDPVRQLYLRFIGKIAANNSTIHAGMTPNQVLDVARRSNATQVQSLEYIVMAFQKLLYRQNLPKEERNRQLRLLRTRVRKLTF